MTTYRNIHGRSIRAVATDPTAEVSEGEIWYNTGSDTFKSIVALEAWSSGSSMIRTTTTAGANHSLGAGIQTAAIYAGGYSPYTNKTEHYNGTGWTSGGDMNLTRITSGFGTSTAAVAAGGITFPGVVGNQAEEYNGTAWTTGNALGTARAYGSGSGILTAGVFFGGSTDGGDTNTVGNTEEYDGTSWSEQNDLNSARKMIGAAGKGPQTAALAFGGDIAPITGNTETYDGTSWTEVNNLNTARENLGGAGDQTSALAFGGVTPTASAATESWDGSSWSTTPATLANARASQPTIGTSTSAMHVGGPNPSFPGGWVEEYNKSANVITGAAWASIANFPDSRAYSGGGGTPTSTLVFGGYDGPGLGGYISTGAEFDGSSWTATGDYVIDVVGVAGIGPVSAGLGCGGNQDNASNVTTSAEYNGSSWTSGNSANASGQGAKMSGSQTSASMGNRSGDGDGHEEYDGTNWTSAANTPVSGNAGAMMAGTQTALLMYGGENSPKVRTELWDGSSWTSGNNMNLDRRQGSYGGTQTYAIAGGGDSNPGIFANTELWNGTSWVSSVNMGTARFYQVGGFTNGPSGVTSNIAATGRTPGSTHSNNCEEFTEGTTTLNVKTLTQS